jgi:hypothetical protein
MRSELGRGLRDAGVTVALSTVVGLLLSLKLGPGAGVAAGLGLAIVLVIASWLVERSYRRRHHTTTVRYVPPGHAASLKSTLSSLERAVAGGNSCDYGDGPGRKFNEEAISAHFPTLSERLRKWDEVAQTLMVNMRYVEGHLCLAADKLGIAPPGYHLEEIVPYLHKAVCERASTARLNVPIRFDWKGFEHIIEPWANGPEWITVAYDRPDRESDEDYRARVKAHIEPVERLASEALTWEETAAITKATYERDTLRPGVIEDLQLTQRIENIPEIVDCPICDRNAQAALGPG